MQIGGSGNVLMLDARWKSTLSVYNTSHHIVYSWFRSIEDANGFRIPF